MKDSTKVHLSSLLMAIIGVPYTLSDSKYAPVIWIITWMCIIGGMIIEKLEKPKP